jgi:hypothetical protein
VVVVDEHLRHATALRECRVETRGDVRLLVARGDEYGEFGGGGRGRLPPALADVRARERVPQRHAQQRERNGEDSQSDVSHQS